MALCSVCKKNTAVVFINKIVDGKPSLEGLCLSCARERGINPLASMMKQYGASEEDIENLNEQFEEIISSISPDGEIPEELGAGLSDPENVFGDQGPLSAIFSNMFSSNLDTTNGENKGTNKEQSNQNSAPKNTNKNRENKKNNKKRKTLEAFGTNLTTRARDGKIDKLIGRDTEIERVTQILNRRTKNNPVLIGEPGVGKTAIAQGLALRIANKDVPAKLLNAEIYQIDMTSMVAGTQFRGQFEARMKSLIEECRELGNIILVIDEIHNIVGAGGDSDHTMNAANILKPALSNGDIQVIGTTTLKEYRKNIEKDAALERRFQPVIVDEPSIQDTVQVLLGIKDYYENYHHVKVSDELIRQIVIMSEKYIHDRFLPDKAIDILDEACSKVNLASKVLSQLQIMKDELEIVREEKENLETITEENKEPDYERIASLKSRESALLTQIADISQGNNLELNLTIEDVASVIENWTKIPASKISETEAEKLLNLEGAIHKRLIGQDKAVTAVCNAIRRNRAGLRNKKRPPSFIFVGPTGVGKTELAKSIASELYGSEDSIIRLDMSEYMESHSVSKFIGSPPGYVGYDDAGQLTEKVRRNPYSLILFDEIEKAHPDVFNILLQILDDGRLTDAQGRTVNFDNTIIIMTSNAGSNLNTNGIGFNKDQAPLVEARVMNSLKESFRPEFLNRVDEVIVFNELTKSELLQIIDLMLNEIVSELEEKNIHITFSKEVKEYILEKGYESKYGARPLRRAIQKYVENELAECLLRNQIMPNEHIILNLINDKIVVTET
ncbi:MAG: ATP-dependent Clp protease ATP-binding subunit [Clostridia bacterium]|nr:ATP-dependent Clp protease ATP-binding subunit [Clostridia bacterium]